METRMETRKQEMQKSSYPFFGTRRSMIDVHLYMWSVQVWSVQLWSTRFKI